MSTWITPPPARRRSSSRPSAVVTAQASFDAPPASWVAVRDDGAERLTERLVDGVLHRLLQPTSSASACSASRWRACRTSVVAPLSRQAASRSAMRARLADERDLVDERVGHRRRRVALAAGEVVILDLGRLGLEAVALREPGVEVLAARSHAADVEREHRLAGSRGRPARRRPSAPARAAPGPSRRGGRRGARTPPRAPGRARRARARARRRSAASRPRSRPSSATFFGPIAAR